MAVLNSKQKTKKPRGPARDTIQFRIDIFSDTKKNKFIFLLYIYLQFLWTFCGGLMKKWDRKAQTHFRFLNPDR